MPLPLGRYRKRLVTEVNIPESMHSERVSQNELRQQRQTRSNPAMQLTCLFMIYHLMSLRTAARSQDHTGSVAIMIKCVLHTPMTKEHVPQHQRACRKQTLYLLTPIPKVKLKKKKKKNNHKTSNPFLEVAGSLKKHLYLCLFDTDICGYERNTQIGQHVRS